MKPSMKQLLHASKVIDANIEGIEPPEAPVEATEDEEEEGEEEEEEEGAASLTVAELKEALDEAEIAYPSSAKKADLVELYEANELGQ